MAFSGQTRVWFDTAVMLQLFHWHWTERLSKKKIVRKILIWPIWGLAVDDTAVRRRAFAKAFAASAKVPARLRSETNTMLSLARTTKPREAGHVELSGTKAKDGKAQYHGKHNAHSLAEDDMVAAGSGASSTSTHDGPPVATQQQEVASAHLVHAAKRTIQQAADVSESQTAEGRWCKLPRQQLNSHHASAANQDALSTADGLVDTDDDNAAALDAALLQPLDDVSDSCACHGSAFQQHGSAFQQQSSGKQRRSRPTMAPDADAGSSNSQDSEPHQLKVLPARPKAISPAVAVGNASTLPRGLLELAALSQPWAALSRQPNPAASSGLAPSASSAFTAVPRKHTRTFGAAMTMQQQPAFPPAGLLHILYTLPAPPLPYPMALPPPLHHIASLVAPVSGRPPVAAAAAAAAGESGRASARQAALSKYLLKRKNRNFSKKVLYESRKRLADARPRVRGQFVKAGEGPAAGAASAKDGGSAPSRVAESACGMERGA